MAGDKMKQFESIWTSLIQLEQPSWSTLIQFDLKSFHFKKTVGLSSFLSKVLSFSLKSKQSQRKWQQLWKKWGLCNCLDLKWMHFSLIQFYLIWTNFIHQYPSVWEKHLSKSSQKEIIFWKLWKLWKSRNET